METNSIDNVAPMWDYLVGLDKFNKDLPVYVKSPFSKEQIDAMKRIINESKEQRPLASLVAPGEQKEFYSEDRFDPRIISHMSRMIVEFECPKDSEEVMDSYVKPIYKDEVRLAHYSYLDYNPKYGDGEYAPALPPHIDGANTLVTFNYCLDANVDWEIYIDNVPYTLEVGDALIFSAVNQVHWRPKRKWKEGEFVEILTFDYSPPDDWRFTGQGSPLDERFHLDFIKEYQKDLNSKKEYVDAWELYDKLGLEINIPRDKHGVLHNGESANNN